MFKTLNQFMHNAEKGQALMEYVVFIPGSIVMILAAAVLSGGLRDIYQQTADGLSQCAAQVTEEQTENQNNETTPLVMNASIHTHTVQLTGVVYNESNNTTTVSYRVTSGNRPAISHWTLGIPQDIASLIVSSNEAFTYMSNDPTTGAAGIKFDSGYNDNQARVITITLRGEFEMSSVNATTKAGRSQVGSAPISAPTSLKQDEPETVTTGSCQ